MMKDEIDIIILGLLMSGPMHGYQLKQYVQRDYLKHFICISVGSLYTRLAKFEAEGLIEGKRELQDKVPDRKVYSITDAGKKRLKELVATPITITGVIFSDLNDFMTHALFFDHISEGQRWGVIKPYLDYITGQLKHADASREAYAEHGILLSELQVLTLLVGRDIMVDISKYLDGLADM